MPQKSDQDFKVKCPMSLYPCILDTSSPKAAVFVVGRKTHNDHRFGKEEKPITVQSCSL